MTRALFVCPNLQAGGAERHWALLLPRLVEAGVGVRVLTLDGTGPFYGALAESGISVSTVADSGRWRSLAGLHTMWRDPGDVIVSRATNADALSLLASRLRPTTRWIANWHFPSGMSMHPRRQAILRAALPRAERIIAVCSSQIDDLVALGVSPEKVTVIANGTDFHPADDARQDARRELGLAEDDMAVLCVGRLEPQKRIDRFIEVVAGAQRDAPNVVGLIAGVGPDQERLAVEVERSGARIRWLGRRDDMPRVLAAADLLCLMSDYEALPFVVLEAMASQRPVLATNVGGLRDVVVPEQTGILVEREDPEAATDALIRLARDPALRTAMGSAGRARQQQLYTAERMSEQYADVLVAPPRSNGRSGRSHMRTPR